jgi:P pilus assembly chaperone PapD
METSGLMILRRILRSSAARVALALLSVLAAGAQRAWAVTVTPTALFIDARSPTGTLVLYNNSTRPEEVEVSFAFGYPTSDAEGRVRTMLSDSAPAGEPSIVSHMRVFPRRFTLAPGQRQTVRVLVQAPPGLAEGEYWGRVVVRSRGGQPPVEQTQGQVRMQLNVETAIATAVLFRKGTVRTGVEVAGATARLAPEGVQAELDVRRTGTAAYLGRVRAEVVAPDGRVVGQLEDTLALYRMLRLRYTIPLAPGAPRAGLTVRYTFDTDRPDLPAEGPVKAPVTAGTAPVRG